MSGGLDVMSMKDDDVTKMLAAGIHLGDSNVNYQMQQYVYKVRPDGTSVHVLGEHVLYMYTTIYCWGDRWEGEMGLINW